MKISKCIIHIINMDVIGLFQIFMTGSRLFANIKILVALLQQA